MVWREREREREVGERQGETRTVRHELPNVKSHMGGETIGATIIHYKGNKCVIRMRVVLLPGSGL
jgi:hypothetical protein